jgi:hypothetical protein
MASQDIWIIIVTIQFVMLLVAVYMMSKPRSVRLRLMNLRMRDSQDVYEAQERYIHFRYHTPFPRVSEPMRGPTLNVSTSAPTPPRSVLSLRARPAPISTNSGIRLHDKSKIASSIFASAPRNPSRFQYYEGGRYRHLDGAAE